MNLDQNHHLYHHHSFNQHYFHHHHHQHHPLQHQPFHHHHYNDRLQSKRFLRDSLSDDRYQQQALSSSPSSFISSPINFSIDFQSRSSDGNYFNNITDGSVLVDDMINFGTQAIINQTASFYPDYYESLNAGLSSVGGSGGGEGLPLLTILTAIFYGSAFIFGTIGNGLIIYIVAHFPKMRSLSNVFLASLAIADLLLVCVCIPVKFIQLITFTWTLGILMCKGIHYVQSLSAYCSVLTLTLISIERYYAIIHPVKCRTTFSMRHIRKMIFFTWFFSAILATPSLHVYMLERIGQDYPEDYFWCVKIDSEWTGGDQLRQQWKETRIVYESYQLLTILIIPTIIMIYTYTKICQHLWTVLHHRSAMRLGHACHLLTSSQSTTTTTTTTTTSCTTLKSLNDNNGSNGNNNNGNNVNNNGHKILTLTSAANDQWQRQPFSSKCHCYLQSSKPNDEDNQTVKQVIKMLVAVVVLFGLCWAPTLIVSLLRGLNIIPETNEGILKEIIPVTFLLSYLNSVINPIIYGFMSKNFRRYFRLIFGQVWLLMRGGSSTSGSSFKRDSSCQEEIVDYCTIRKRLSMQNIQQQPPTQTASRPTTGLASMKRTSYPPATSILAGHQQQQQKTNSHIVNVIGLTQHHHLVYDQPNESTMNLKNPVTIEQEDLGGGRKLANDNHKIFNV